MQHWRHWRRRVHRAASASRRRHGEPAASESAAARTSAATQPSAEAALARAAVSGEQSEGWVEESMGTGERSTGAMSDAACIAQRARAAATMAGWLRARAPSRGRARRCSRAPRRRWLEPRSAASRAMAVSRIARIPPNAARSSWTTVVHRAASASRCRHGGPAARESAVAWTSAAKQPGTEAALARAAVSGAQSEGQAEESTSIDERSKGTMNDDGASRSERDLPPAWQAGGERECRRADERSDAAERRGGAGSSRGQRRAE